jgi:CheY-like chemotaxis protein
VTHKLLLADDSVTIQRVVELTFSGEDVQVVTVGDGEQAIARIPVELPDIVLADIGMPKRSGYDVAAFVKGRSDLSHIPVLLLAGAFEPVDETRAQQVHSDGVLVKPFEPQQVISRVKDLIASSRGASHHRPAAIPALSVTERRARNGEAMANSVPPAVTIPQPSAAILESRDRRGESKLDDYFERLDAAFAQLGNDPEPATPAHASAHDEFDGGDVPTLESLLGARSSSHFAEPVPPAAPSPIELTAYDPSQPQAAPVTHSPFGVGESSQPRDGRNLVADMFAALFAVEQGESIAPATSFPTPRPQAPAVTDNLVDEVTRRVIERLAPEAAHDLVAQIVSEVAERVIREEIARIKAAAATRL